VGDDADAFLRRGGLRGQARHGCSCGRRRADWRRLAAALAADLAFFGDARRTGAFFTGFFLAVLVFLRVAALAARRFLRVALVLLLAFFLVAI
jgi:hypothetical protein